jgi:hypothetical protein
MQDNGALFGGSSLANGEIATFDGKIFRGEQISDMVGAISIFGRSGRKGA